MEKRIYYHDTDAGGVVYYGNYLRFLEEARTEHLEQCGLDIDLFRQKKFLYAVRQCNVTYKSPARYGDTIVCDAKIVKMTPVQIMFKQTIKEKSDGRLLVVADVSIVSLNSDFKPTAIPADLKEKFESTM